MQIFTNYTQMVATAIHKGTSKAGTKSLGETYFTFAIPKANDGLLLFPKTRMGLKTYTSYALAEAAWYMSRDRRVDWISKYGHKRTRQAAGTRLSIPEAVDRNCISFSLSVIMWGKNMDVVKRRKEAISKTEKKEI